MRPQISITISKVWALRNLHLIWALTVKQNQDGNVKFNVYTDNKQVCTQVKLLREHPRMAKLDISVEGVKILRLNVDQNGSDSNDHADFADAKFITELVDDTTRKR